MSDFEKESLSALMDGEADDLALRRLLKSMDQDSDLGATWERYHLVQAVIHDQGMPVNSSVARGVAQALEQEPELQSQSVSGFRQQLGRIAVAACVAVVAVVALQPASSPQSTPQLAEESAPAMDSISASPAVTLVADAPIGDVDPEAQRRLQEYIESMSFDDEEPVRIEHIQDSPLYRLVNELQSSPR